MATKKDEKPRTRAWQFKFQKGKEHNRPWSLCTLNVPKRSVGNVHYEAQIVLLDPNFALQYVIDESAIEYEAQIEAMLRHAELSSGNIEELNLKSKENPEGTDVIGEIPDRFIIRPPEVALQIRVDELETAEAEKEQTIAELRAELEAYKAAQEKAEKASERPKNR
jgi:hypothetical protein